MLCGDLNYAKIFNSFHTLGPDNEACSLQPADET